MNDRKKGNTTLQKKKGGNNDQRPLTSGAAVNISSYSALPKVQVIIKFYL